VTGGLVSAVLFIPGLLLPAPWGYGLVAAGFFLGPWLPVRFVRSSSQIAAPAPPSGTPKWRAALRLLPLAVFLPVWSTDLASILSVEDNRLFLQDKESRAGRSDWTDGAPDETLKVTRLSSGSIRYREINPQGRNIILGFHGFQESLYEFPRELQTRFEEMNIRGIFIDRPGIGPVSTPWPGHDLADWAALVEEFDKKVLDSRPISIVGHSAGGVYALACAKLACVRALGLASSPPPLTYASFFKTFLDYDPYWQQAVIGLELFPHKLIPDMQLSCQQILHDWKSFRDDMIKALGPIDGAVIRENDEAFRKEMVTSVLQGAAPTIDDFRRTLSPWPLTAADTTRVPILIFRGAGDQVVPLSGTQELQARFAPNAIRVDFPDMGHQPALRHYDHIFEAVAKLHVQEEQRRLASNANR